MRDLIVILVLYARDLRLRLGSAACVRQASRSRLGRRSTRRRTPRGPLS